MQAEKLKDEQVEPAVDQVRHWTFVGTLVCVLFAASILGLTLAHVLARPVEPNERMYIAASVLSLNHTRYQDFAFVQMPYLPACYAATYSFLDSQQYLLISRIVTWCTFMVLLACVIRIAWHYVPDPLFAASAAAVLACSESMILVTGESSNYVIPACLSLIAFWLFLSKRSRFSAIWIGVLLGASVCFKLYYATLIPIFIVFAYLSKSDQHSRTSRAWFAGVMILGVGVSVLPAFIELLSDPDRFMFNNLGFHRWKTQVYRNIGYGDRMTLHSRIQLGKTVYQHGSQMWFVFVCILASGFLFNQRRRFHQCNDVLMASVLTGACLLTSLVPIPAWSQYFAMAVPFAMVVAIQLCARHPRLARSILCTTAAVGFVVSGPYYARAVAKAVRPSGRVPTKLHLESQKLVQTIPKPNPLIGTMRTLIPLEGGGRIYNEFALAGFMFELSEHLSDERIDHYCVTSPQTIDDLFDERPPDAIITCPLYEDQPLADYASAKGFQEIKNTELNVSLWLPGSIAERQNESD